MAEDDDIAELIDWIDSSLPQVEILAGNIDENKKIVDEIAAENTELQRKIEKNTDVSDGYTGKLAAQDKEHARNIGLLPNPDSKPEFAESSFKVSKSKHQKFLDDIGKAKRKAKKLEDEAVELDHTIAPVAKELKDPVKSIKDATEAAGKDYDGLQDVVDLVQDLFGKMEELSAMWQDRVELSEEYKLALNKIAVSYQKEIEFIKGERDRRQTLIKNLIHALGQSNVEVEQATTPPLTPKDSSYSMVASMSEVETDDGGNEEDIKALRDWIAHADTQMKVFDDQVAAEQPKIQKVEPEMLTVTAQLSASKQIDTQVEHGLNHQDQQFQAWLSQAQEKGIDSHNDFNADKFAIHASYTDKLDQIDDKEMALSKAQKVARKAKGVVDDKKSVIDKLESQIAADKKRGDLDSLDNAVQLIQQVFEHKGDYSNAVKQMSTSYQKQVDVGRELNNLRHELTDMKNREKRRRDRVLKKIELKLKNAGVTPNKVPEKVAAEALDPVAAAEEAMKQLESGGADDDDEKDAAEKLSAAGSSAGGDAPLDEDQKAFLEWIEDANKQIADVLKDLKDSGEKYSTQVKAIAEAADTFKETMKRVEECEKEVKDQDAEYTTACEGLPESAIPEQCRKDAFALQESDDINEYKTNLDAAKTEHEGDDEAHKAKHSEAEKLAKSLEEKDEKIKSNAGNNNLDVLEAQTVLIGEVFEGRQNQLELVHTATSIAEAAASSAGHQDEVAQEIVKTYEDEISRRRDIIANVKSAAEEQASTAGLREKKDTAWKEVETEISNFNSARDDFKELVKDCENTLIAVTTVTMSLDSQEDNYVPTDDAHGSEFKVKPFAEEAGFKESQSKLQDARNKTTENEGKVSSLQSTTKDAVGAVDKAGDDASADVIQKAIDECATAVKTAKEQTATMKESLALAKETKRMYQRKVDHLNEEKTRRDNLISNAGQPSKENVPPGAVSAEPSPVMSREASGAEGRQATKQLLRSDSLAALLASDGEEAGDEPVLDESQAALSEPDKTVSRAPAPGTIDTEIALSKSQQKAATRKVLRSESLRALLESDGEGAEDSSSHAAPSEMQHSIASGEILTRDDFEEPDSYKTVAPANAKGWVVLDDKDLPDVPPELQEDAPNFADMSRQSQSELPLYLQNMLGTTNLKGKSRGAQPWAVTKPRGRTRDPFKVFIFPETARSNVDHDEPSWSSRNPTKSRPRPSSAHVSSGARGGPRGNKARPVSARPRLATAAAPERPTHLRASAANGSRRPQSARVMSSRLGAPTKARPQSARVNRLSVTSALGGASPYDEPVRIGMQHQPKPPRSGSARAKSARSKKLENRPAWDNMVGVVSSSTAMSSVAPAKGKKRPVSGRKTAKGKGHAGGKKGAASRRYKTGGGVPVDDMTVSRPPQAPKPSAALSTMFHEGIRKLMSLWGLLGYPRDKRLRFVHAHGQVTQENFQLIQTEVNTFIRFRELVLDILELIEKREKVFSQIRRDLLDRQDTADNENFSSTVITFLEVTEQVSDAIEHLKESADWITSFNYHGQDYEKKIMEDAEYLKRYRTQNAQANSSSPPRPPPVSTHHAAHIHRDDMVSHSPKNQPAHAASGYPGPQSHHGNLHRSSDVPAHYQYGGQMNGHGTSQYGGDHHQVSSPDGPWHASRPSKQHEQRVESLLRDQAFSDIDSPTRSGAPPFVSRGDINMYGDNGPWDNMPPPANGVYISDDSADLSPDNEVLQEVRTPVTHTPVRSVGTQESSEPKYIRAQPGRWTEAVSHPPPQREQVYINHYDSDSSPQAGQSHLVSHSNHRASSLSRDSLSPSDHPSQPIRRTNSVHWFDDTDEAEPPPPPGLKRSGSILRIHQQADESELVDARDIREEGEKIKAQIKEKKHATAELEAERARFEEEREALMREREALEQQRAALAMERGESVAPAPIDPIDDDADTAPVEPAVEAEPEVSAHDDSPVAPVPPAAPIPEDEDVSGDMNGDIVAASDSESLGSDDLSISWHSSEEEQMDAALERLMSSGDLMADFPGDGDDGNVDLPEVTDDTIDRNQEEV